MEKESKKAEDSNTNKKDIPRSIFFFKRYEYYIVAILLICFFTLCFTSIMQKSVTNDEILHIAAGYTYWKSGYFRFNPEHPPLLKLIATAPLLLTDTNVSFEDTNWITAKKYDKSNKQWSFAENFFFRSNNDVDSILIVSRTPMIILAVILGLVLYLWTKELFGIRSGMLALLLFAFSPNLIAHSRLVTTDVGVGAFIFFSCYSFWKYTKKPSWKLLIQTGILIGATIASKFTGIYILPLISLLGLLYAYYFFRKQDMLLKDIKELKIFSIAINKKFLKILLNTAIAVILMSIIAFVVLLASYFFYDFGSYIYGLQSVTEHSISGHNSFLLGEHSSQGWWYYFFVAFLLKTPVPTIILLLISVIFFITYKTCRRENIIDEYFIVLPVVIFFGAFIFNHINIGIRHILPIYPFIFMFISRVANIRFKTIKWVIWIGIIWYIYASLGIYPDYISYFNEIAGGPGKGLDYLIDSNIDWGQDLKTASRWMKEHDIDQVYLTYFGHESPKYRGINWTDMPWCELTEGYIMISVNFLKGFTKGQEFCSSWLYDYNEPIAKIGNSIYVYNITDDDIVRMLKINNERCKKECTKTCKEKSYEYEDSSMASMNINSCDCSCKLSTDKKKSSVLI